MKHKQTYSLWHSAGQFLVAGVAPSFRNVFNDSALDFANQRWIEAAILSLEDAEGGD
jgi:hypothetical protein